MFAKTLLLCVLAGSSCSHVDPRPPSLCPPDRLLTRPPPVPPDPYLAGPEEGCPPRFAGCLTSPELGKLETYVGTLQTYANLAWTMLGPLPDGGTP